MSARPDDLVSDSVAWINHLLELSETLQPDRRALIALAGRLRAALVNDRRPECGYLAAAATILSKPGCLAENGDGRSWRAVAAGLIAKSAASLRPG